MTESVRVPVTFVTNERKSLINFKFTFVKPRGTDTVYISLRLFPDLYSDGGHYTSLEVPFRLNYVFHASAPVPVFRYLSRLCSDTCIPVPTGHSLSSKVHFFTPH